MIHCTLRRAWKMMRILAGRHKGRKLLPPPAGSVTRPITGLAKKSLFDTLGGLPEGAAVVDLFCGTGSMGLEALSRGSRACWFAERDRKVVERLRRNIEAIGAADCCTIWQGDVMHGLRARLAEVDGPVDVAFVDPPYEMARRWSWAEAADAVFRPLAESLAAHGVVVLRLPADVQVPEPLGGLAKLRQRRFGEMALVLLSRAKAE